MVRVGVSESDFDKFVDANFEYFSNDKIYRKGYKITAIYHETVLGCYVREDEDLYLAAKEDADLDRLGETLGLDFDWL